jgi:alpha-tubulin suppressor-like RCC1 family protein
MNYSVFGQNSFQQLSKEISENPIRKFESIEYKFKILQICLNWSQTLILTKDGKIFIHGRNKENTFEVELLLKENIKFMDTCFSHSGAIDDKGKVYIWENYKFKPTEIKMNEKMKKISFSDEYLLLLSENGVVFQYNLEDSKITNLKGDLENVKIINIASGPSHSLFIDSEGCVYSFGWNGYGQCSFDTNVQFVSPPMKIELLENIKKISCGSKHSLFLTSKNYFKLMINSSRRCLWLWK